jgi:hypothetical protein
MGIFCIALDHGRNVGCAFGWLEPIGRQPFSKAWSVPAIGGVTQWKVHTSNLRAIIQATERPAGSRFVICYESPLTNTSRTNGKILRLHVGLAAMTEYLGQHFGAEVSEQDSGEVRKLVLGRGTFAKPMRAAPRLNKCGKPVGDPKAEVEAWHRERGWAIDSEHARDAAVIWRYCQMLLLAKGGTHPGGALG